MKYHCESYDEKGIRFGGFVVEAENMPHALIKAANNIEVHLRLDQFQLRITQLKESKS